MVKNVVNSIVVEPKQKRGRKPKNATALLTTNTENKVLEDPLTILEKDNNIIFSIQEITIKNLNQMLYYTLNAL